MIKKTYIGVHSPIDFFAAEIMVSISETIDNMLELFGFSNFTSSS